MLSTNVPCIFIYCLHKHFHSPAIWQAVIPCYFSACINRQWIGCIVSRRQQQSNQQLADCQGIALIQPCSRRIIRHHFDLCPDSDLILSSTKIKRRQSHNHFCGTGRGNLGSTVFLVQHKTRINLYHDDIFRRNVHGNRISLVGNKNCSILLSFCFVKIRIVLGFFCFNGNGICIVPGSLCLGRIYIALISLRFNKINITFYSFRNRIKRVLLVLFPRTAACC